MKNSIFYGQTHNKKFGFPRKSHACIAVQAIRCLNMVFLILALYEKIFPRYLLIKIDGIYGQEVYDGESPR